MNASFVRALLAPLLALPLMVSPGCKAEPSPSVAPASRSAAIRILPLGDSITQGGRDEREYTYRYPLFWKLKAAGYEADFIGSQTEGFNSRFVWPAKNGVAFDPHHEGHYGWTTAEVRDNLREWMPQWSATPDIALIHLGTNDQNASNYKSAIIEPLKAIITLLREKNPRVVILIGHLNFNEGPALQIRPLVEAMAKSLTTRQSPVLTVAHYRNWRANPDLPNSDTFDWLHPNSQGQAKMASNWFAAMQPFLKAQQRKATAAKNKPLA